MATVRTEANEGFTSRIVRGLEEQRFIAREADGTVRVSNYDTLLDAVHLDLGLAFTLVGEERYKEVAERLRHAGFEVDTNDEGKPTRQRWRISDPAVTVNFLIEPVNIEAKPGRLFPLNNDWAAIGAPGLHLAFEDKRVTKCGYRKKLRARRSSMTSKTDKMLH